MSLAPGQTLGHFVILQIIGRGGMGDVFRARDGRLGREVAIKVLSEEFAREPDGLPRFHREARTLATLAHPAIAAIHGLEEHNGLRFLVLEYVPGETLAELLARGPLPVHRALEIARQIALGLEAAHDKGIVHRDLKPANIKVGPDGRVKILDFGIAKTMLDGRAQTDAENTMTIESTDEGVVLGTAAYMSPEQARGRDLDRRTDIWSFGCLLFESLTGLRAFTGETVTDIMAAVLSREPNWNALPAATPRRIRGLLRRCLERDADRRLHDIADARIEIEDALAAPGETDPAGPPPRHRGGRLLWFSAGILTATMAAAVGSRFVADGGPKVVRRLSLGPLPGAPLLQVGSPPSLAVTRDGRRVAYAGEGAGAPLYVRDLSAFAARAVPGTAGATHPFFSPDGEWLGFTAGGKLHKIPVAGGRPDVVSELPATAGASWDTDGSIVFAPGCASGPSDCGLFLVSPAKGTQHVTRADASEREVHSLPRLLPGGRVLFIAEKGTQRRVREARIASLSAPGSTQAVAGGAEAAVFASGHLLYRRGCTLFGRRFDPRRLALEGSPAVVATDVHAFEAADDDTLFLTTGCIPAETEVQLLDAGGAGPFSTVRHTYSSLAVSPDGTRVAVTIGGGLERDIALLDVARGELVRLTSGEGHRERPVWTPDGQRLAYERREPEELRGLYWIRAEPGSPEEPLLLSKEGLGSVSFTPDMSAFAYERATEAGGETWLLPLTGTHTPPRLLQPGALNPRLSPDGRWLAYELQEERQRTVWVAAFPDVTRRRGVSQGGGRDPVWSRDSRWLYFRADSLPTRILKVALEPGPDPRPSPPVLFFEGPVDAGRRFDTLPGDDRLLALKGQPPRSMQVTVVTNWSRGF